MKQAILWDLDGTLLYTLQDIANATNATLRAFHLPERSLEEVRSFVGNGAAQQMRRSAGGEPENFEEIMAFYRAYYPQHCNETTRPYDGILETASQLKANGWPHIRNCVREALQTDVENPKLEEALKVLEKMAQ